MDARVVAGELHNIQKFAIQQLVIREFRRGPMVSRRIVWSLVASSAVVASSSTILAAGVPLTPDAPGFGDYFGYSTAAFGSTVVVGSPNDGAHGAAYVFAPLASGDWEIAARLAPPDTEKGRIGFSIDSDGRTVIAGGPSFNSFSIPVPGAIDGVAYLFESSLAGWAQIAKLDVAGARADSFSGFDISVAVDGDVAVVGTRYDDAVATLSGSAYVFERNKNGADAWGLAAKLAPGDLSAQASFGFSVDVEGDTIVVGAPSNESPSGSSGSVYEFRRDTAGAWTQAARIDSPPAALSSFGWSLSLDGHRLAIGAPRYDSRGAVYVMSSLNGDGDDWELESQLSGTEHSLEFGKSVALTGNMLAVGAPLGPFSGAVPADAAYLFRSDGAGGWGPVLTLTEEGATRSTAFGHSVSLSENTLVVGGFQNNRFGESSGVAYVYSVPEPALGWHGLIWIAMAMSSIAGRGVA